MKKEDISRLLQRYLSARDIGKEPYFDADELSELLDSFEESEDYQYYGEVLALGLKLHPGNIDIKIRQGRFHVYNEEYDEAIALIDSIAETDNQDLDLIRLECYCMLNQYDKIIEYTEQLIEDDCDYLETVFEYIVPLLNDMDMVDEANDYMKRGIDLFPDNLLLKDELCYTLEVEGKFEEAINVCNEMIDKDPYSYDNWFTLGRLYSFNNEFDKAIEAFDFALTCDDTDPELKVLKAYCHYMNENYEKALEVYLEVVNNPDKKKKKFPMSDRIIALMAECYMKLEDYEGAYNILKDIIGKNNSLESSTYINYIRCCTETERDREASKMLMRAVTLFPTDIRILSVLALTYVENGEDELAIETTERLFALLDKDKEHNSPEDYDSLLNAAQFLYMKGDMEKALKYYNKILEIRPSTPFIHLHMAMAYLELGDVKHFRKHFSRTSHQDMINYLEQSGVDISKVEQHLFSKHIPPEDLAKEFLNNKDNNN